MSIIVVDAAIKMIRLTEMKDCCKWQGKLHCFIHLSIKSSSLVRTATNRVRAKLV